jgi:hypothetical protein
VENKARKAFVFEQLFKKKNSPSLFQQVCDRLCCYRTKAISLKRQKSAVKIGGQQAAETI